MSDEYIEADLADMDREHNDCPAVLTVDIPASAALRICVRAYDDEDGKCVIITEEVSTMNDKGQSVGDWERASGDAIVCNFDELPLLIGALELSLKRLMST